MSTAEGRQRDCRLVEQLQTALSAYERDWDVGRLQGILRGLSTSLEGDTDPRLRASIPDLSGKLDLWEAVNPGHTRIRGALSRVIAEVTDLCDEVGG